VLGHPDPTITYPTHAGYTLYLAEEFNEPIDFTTDPNWTWSDGGLTEGQVRFIQDQIKFPATVTDDVAGHNGYMTITCAVTPTNLTIPAMSYAENRQIGPEPYVSGEFRTKYNNYRYGWYEARYKPPPSTEGNFISTMFVFRTPKTISWREIDVELTPDVPNKLGTNVYLQSPTSNPPADGTYNAAFADVGSDVITGVADNSTAFHTYAIDWQPTYVKWYVDGQLIRTKDMTHYNNKSVGIPELSTKIMMNLWIFNTSYGFGGNGAKNAYPMTAEYDYFRFYKLDADTMYPCSPTPSCVTHADNVRSKNNPDDGVMFNAQ
jgi:beta-glucanase (GH16 family)